jgi:GNAT superfamily N-acetyltransferase
MLTIRAATREDVPALVGFIRELAEYEKLLHECHASEASLAEHLFPPPGRPAFAEALVACEDRVPVGFALYFHNYSTFLTRPGIYLEDLYVQPSQRGRGVGKALLTRLAQVATDRGCGRLEWSVLDWNSPSIAFYESLGAKPQSDWTTYRLTGEALMNLARAR